MKKLFLASIAYLTLDKAIELFPDNPTKLTVAFIPTAANLYEDKSWLMKDRDKLTAMGFTVKDVNLEEKTKEQLQKELTDIDVIFVSGGNTFYLLQQVRESGFDEIVKDMIEKGVVYIGSSAGAVLVSPTIEPVKGMDDEADAPRLTSYEGLGIVDYLVLPHYGDDYYKEQYKRMLNEWGNKGYELKLLTNNQALIVNGTETHLVEE